MSQCSSPADAAVVAKIQEIEAKIADSETKALSPELDCYAQQLPFAARVLIDGFYNALQLCMEALPQQPTKVLIIGGCRQRDMARKLAFLLPHSKIFVLDPDYDIYLKAKEEIHCRFEFIPAAIGAMDMFEADSFDLVIAHHLMEYLPEGKAGLQRALPEIQRVCQPQGHVIISTHEPSLWKIITWIPGAAKGFQALGCKKPAASMPFHQFQQPLSQLGNIGLQLNPWPWQLWLLQNR